MSTFNVKVKDKASGRESVLQVTANSNIQTQADAEAHVGGMDRSLGGTHPGFDVVPAEAKE